jgi:hypothetical protein
VIIIASTQKWYVHGHATGPMQDWVEAAPPDRGIDRGENPPGSKFVDEQASR